MALLPLEDAKEAILARVREVRGGAATLDFESPQDWFHAGQLRAWDSQALEIVIIAGAQGGKTAFLPYFCLRETQRCFPLVEKLGYGNGLFIGPTLNLLQAQALPAFERLFVDELKLGKMIHGNKPKFIFSKEGLMKIFGTDKYPFTIFFCYANDSSNLESVTACWAVWDEAGQKENKRASKNACDRRLDLARAQGYGRRAWASTPYEWGWFKTTVHDPAFNNEPGFELFRFPTWMNPLHSEEEIRAKLKWMQLWEWEMMHEGLFRKPAGAVVPNFDKALIPAFAIPAHWRRLSGHDFGTVNMAAVFAAQDPKTGIVYIYGTYHPNENGRKDVVTTEAHIGSMLKKQGLRVSPNAWGGAPSEDKWRSDFTRAGYAILKPPVPDLFEGIHRLNSLIDRGLIKVFDNLSHLSEEFFTYSYKLTDSGDIIDRVIEDKETYHRIDCCRYLACALYEGLAEVLPEEPDSRFEPEQGFEKRPNHFERMLAGLRD